MTSVHAIKTAVQRLVPRERAEFRAWFEAFDAQEWDQQMADDVATGSQVDSCAAGGAAATRSSGLIRP